MEALTGSSDFSEFYERLKVIKEHHRKYPNEAVEPPEMEYIHLTQKKDEEDYQGIESEQRAEWQSKLNALRRIGKAVFWRREPR